MREPRTTRGSNARVVLEGVPRVGFYFDMQKHDDSKMRCPEDVPFPSCLRACLEFLDDGLGCRKIVLSGGPRGLGCEKVRKLAEPEVRREMVPIIHQARDKDAEAAQHIERALADRPQ